MKARSDETPALVRGIGSALTGTILSADDQEICLTLAGVIASARKGEVTRITAHLPPAPRCCLKPMALYRFRLIDNHGLLIGARYLPFDSDDAAIRYAETALGEYDCGCVEVWAGDNLISAAMQRLR